MSQFSHLVELLQYRAIAQPNDIAYKFLSNGVTEAGSLTYQELDRRAKAIASRLQSLVKPGARALLVYPYHEGLEFIAAFMGCLYAKVIAVTKSTPRRGNAIAELTERVKLSGATVLLTTKEFLSIVETEVAKNKNIAGKFKFFPRLATDQVDLSLENEWQSVKIAPDTIAFLQYTSGSTGTPKGVMVTHQNILHNEETIRQGFNHDESTIVVGWLPMFHDMGLIGNILQPLYLGTPSILMSPVSLSQQPFEWLKAITHYQATTSGGPNFAYDLLCLKATPEKLAGLDLSNWKVAFSGAETVRGETIDRFSHIFANCGFNKSAFYPCYGMAEATLFITGGLQQEDPIIKYVDGAALEKNQVVEIPSETAGSKAIVGCGRQWLDTEVLIVNPETLTPCQPHEVGEIWVLGSGIGKGYWEQEQETLDTFQGLLKGTKSPEYLRTGDLGFLQNGELYITGRLKEVMLFWSRYCYPQHVEQTVQKSHPALRKNAGAAFAIDKDGAERLVIVQEVERSSLRSLTLEEIVTAICQSAGEAHEVEVHAIALLKTGSIPKTSSGKIQRRACSKKFLEGDLNIVAQWQQNQEDKAVTEMVSL